MKFESIGQYETSGRRVFTVKNPADCDGFKFLIGATVDIDGQAAVVAAVEHFAHLPPYRKGELIGLMVE